ncbi:MAG TPA: hypothetical protein VKV28_09535 [Candidatus Binataceae bacterium]|nr:hypothetical protein [Candidatus Binataceae bacterium]
MPGGELLLVGSIPYETVAEVFSRFGGTLGSSLDYLPDGEVGERQYWIDGIAYRVFNGHPELETIKRPAPEDGVERWQPRNAQDQFAFRVRPGVSAVRFGDPGWRLGYARDAINSYFIFRALKQNGTLPAHLRFQVCLPLPLSAVLPFFPAAGDAERVLPGFTAAMRAEVAKMVEKIPPAELAIQWDCAVESGMVDGAQAGGAQALAAAVRRAVAPLPELSPNIPAATALGYHLCFGTLGGWPMREPRDLSAVVALANAAIEASGRPVNFVHFPTLERSDEAFFAPLAELAAPAARVYLGMIHHRHDRAGIRAQIRTARRYISDFGLAAPCGFGRSSAAELPGLLRDHQEALELLRETRD